MYSLKSEVDRGERSDSRPGPFTLRQKVSCTHSIAGRRSRWGHQTDINSISNRSP